MKTKFGFIGATVLGLMASGCAGLPTCVDELDQCSRNGPYTEERTAKAAQKVVVAVEPMSEPAPVVEPAPQYEPVKTIEQEVMTSAEPQFKQVAK